MALEDPVPIEKEELLRRIAPHVRAIFEVFVEDCAEGRADDELRVKMAKAIETGIIGTHGACDVLTQAHGKGPVEAEVIGDAPRVTPLILLDAGLAAPKPACTSNLETWETTMTKREKHEALMTFYRGLIGVSNRIDTDILIEAKNVDGVPTHGPGSLEGPGVRVSFTVPYDFIGKMRDREAHDALEELLGDSEDEDQATLAD
ncbi:MAG: hypothetical protein F4060_09405 [Holophagales bacterium]|nr:hypothetical protein [Holophagales bacterium]MYI80148.1 hypothetical protein [Holophagales bacterium]